MMAHSPRRQWVALEIDEALEMRDGDGEDEEEDADESERGRWQELGFSNLRVTWSFAYSTSLVLGEQVAELFEIP